MEEQNPIIPSETNEPPVIPPVEPIPVLPIQSKAPATTLPSQETPKSPKPILKWVLIALTILLFGLSGFLAYQVLGLKKQVASRPTPTVSPPEVKPTPSPEAVIESTPPAEVVNYKPRSDWQTYTDEVSGFSIQYNTTKQPPYNSHQELGTFTRGSTVKIMSCFTPPSGPSAGKNTCSRYYTITIYKNYSGGSRRSWLKENLKAWCEPVYYQDLKVADSNALFMSRECNSSWGETFVAIPKNNNIFLLEYGSGSLKPKEGKPSVLDSVIEILSTFKFTN